MANPDVIILGAGAAGLLCAIEAGRRGRNVRVLESGPTPGAKIRISGGGRCNFTNLYCGPDDFLSDNPHFCRSALARFTPQDFIDRVDAAGIEWHEKKLGQLFCTERGGAALIVDLLLEACRETGHVEIQCNTNVQNIRQTDTHFEILLPNQTLLCKSVVIATGGPSIPKMGASGFGYEIARRFGLPLVTPEPALVPLTLAPELLHKTSTLSGLSLPVQATAGRGQFQEGMLFTHRGLSGPAILQISSYWSAGDNIEIDLLPEQDLAADLEQGRREAPRKHLLNFLENKLPARLAEWIATESGYDGTLAHLTAHHAERLVERIHRWRCRPAGSEGFRTAEVTRGGVSTQALSSKTMECREHPGLYFIGEVVDVTGHLGGFNFQWAWSSGYAAGQVA